MRLERGTDEYGYPTRTPAFVQTALGWILIAAVMSLSWLFRPLIRKH